ncbi:MAG: hypothetical protein CL927_13330 [Deltaproteobacteria bacterium]|nr:hypothetical protein [Deltaproteobacteria bacterium]HCH61330.1 hypothetical protein [Deltaproteobacteria bacterium]
MDTFFAKNRLSAYLDGALPEAEASEVADAIARDPELKAEYESLRAALAVLRQHGPVSAPEGFKARVMAQVDRETASGGIIVRLRRRLTRVPLEAVAVAAAAIIVIFTTTSRMSDPATATAPAVASKPVAAPDAPAEVASAPRLPAADAQAAAAPAAPTSAPNTVAAPKSAPAPAGKAAASQPVAAPAPKKRGSPSSPATAYVPEWESEKASSDRAFGTIEGLSLSVSDPKVLEKLYLLTERYGGRMLDEASQTLRPYALTAEDPVARLILMVPVDRAATLRDQLAGLGATAGSAPTGGPALTAGYSGFYIEARLLP